MTFPVPKPSEPFALVPASCLRCKADVLTIPTGNREGLSFDLPEDVDGTLFAMVHGCCWDRWDEEEEPDPSDYEDLP